MKYKIFNKFGLSTLLLSIVLITSSCEKEFDEAPKDNTPVAYASVHNFALRTGGNSSVFVNNTQLALGGSNVALAFNTSLLGLGNYIGVKPGDVTVGLRTATGTTNYATRTVNIAQTSYTSFFAYDTLTTAGTAKLLVLNNNMKPADTATSNIRFLHLSPNAGNINVVLTRTLNQFGLAATGTVITLSNVPYIGATATPNEAALSAFTNIPAGTYSVLILSGTTTILPTGTTNLVLREGKNYSVVARGFSPFVVNVPTSLNVTSLIHNP